MLRRLAGDDADDLAQETLLAAWRSAGSWRGESGYFAWLARIAWRRFLTHHAGRKAHAQLDEAEGLAVAPDADRASAINQALGRLGQRERMAALLCFAEGYTHMEAAAIMQLPLGTVKSLVARARSGLMNCLEEER